MAENISLEIFGVEEFTVLCSVPKYWNDASAWDDGSQFAPIPFRGIYEEPYKRLDMGESGQDSSLPQVRFPTALIPNAREGDEITIHRELPDNTGEIQFVEETYRVATVKPNGYGVTECLLYEDGA